MDLKMLWFLNTISSYMQDFIHICMFMIDLRVFFLVVIHSILSKFGFYQYFSLLLSKLVSQAANSEKIMRNINICQVLISHWLPKDDKMLDMMIDFLCFPILKPNREWPCLAQMQIFVVNMTKNFIRLLMTIPLTYFTSSP